MRIPAQAWKKLLTLRSSFCLPSSCVAAQVEATLKAGVNSVANVTAGAGVQVVVRLPADYTATAAPRRQANIADATVM